MQRSWKRLRACGGSQAIAQDDATWLHEPSPQSDHTDLTSDEDIILNGSHCALTAPAHIKPVDLTTATQPRNLEQALANSLQQMSQLNQVLKDFLGQAVTQIVQCTIDLHSRGKGKYIASESHNTFNGITTRSAHQRKAHQCQRTVPKIAYCKGCRLSQSTRNVTLNKGAPTHTHAVQLNALSSTSFSQGTSRLEHNARTAAHDGNMRYVVSPDGLQP